jgi:argininosuccinate lyase
MPFAPEYVRCVLAENFEDAKALFLSPLLAIHAAHLVMLVDRDIMSREDGRVLHDALDSISETDVRAATFEPGCEDLFFYIERLIENVAGDIAGRLHTARSRNDIDMTMYRMRLREFVLGMAGATVDLRRALIDVAAQHHETIFAAHTHTQPAQPTTVAHYLLAVIEQLERDTRRLRAAFETTNRCPLGACAITGTGFQIDRTLTSRLLGFASPTGNTYGSIASVDYLLESISAVAVLLTGLGRVVDDFLMWCTAEVDYLRLSDGFVQCSSIMPQKRNPVALEHVRAIGSRALGQAQAVVMTVHNTPFGDIVDIEDDLQPVVAATFRDAWRAIAVVTAAMPRATFNVERMKARAGERWITVTELADTLARDRGLPFKTAHALAAGFVAAQTRTPDRPAHETLAEVSAPFGIDLSREEVERALSPRHFVAVRQTYGGPAPEETRRAIAEARRALDDDAAWRAHAHGALENAARELKERLSQL